MSSLFTQLSFLFFAIATLLYLSYFIFQKQFLLSWGKKIVVVSFFLQSFSMGIYIHQVGYPFLLKATDSYLFSVWVLSALFLLMGFKYRLEGVGALFLSPILILYTLAYFTEESYQGAKGFLDSPWAAIHIVLGFLAFSIFFLSFILGSLFLLQEFQLKRKQMFRIFNRLPSLELLDQLHYKALTVGFVLLTLGIVSGSAWAKSVKGVYFFDDPRQIWTVLAWLVYAFFFQVRFSAGWKGRRGVLLSLVGFMVILFTFLEVKHT